ncbi:glycosyltransferase [Akkermansiaceae bacterium]|nr:glycosyltransferase [Akkermansiaceae bacterium]
MKIAIVGKNPESGYSGGRIHALMVALGCARLGHAVDYYTNNKPVFFEELSPLSQGLQINFIITKTFLKIPSGCDYQKVFVIPHLATIKNFLFDKIFFYGFVNRLRQLSSAQLSFLDFESPNWIAESSTPLRSRYCYLNSDCIIDKCDSIFSSTLIGSRYAREYYGKMNPKLQFNVLSPPINSVAAEMSRAQTKTDSIVFFARFGQKHKGSEALVEVIDAIPRGFQFVVISNRNVIPVDVLLKIEAVASRNQVSIVFRSQISEVEKFRLLARSRLLLFATKFEGFGLPPVEAQFVNTPVICSNLPVLREVNDLAVFDSFTNSESLREKIEKVLSSPPKGLKESVESVARFENFAMSLENHL